MRHGSWRTAQYCSAHFNQYYSFYGLHIISHLIRDSLHFCRCTVTRVRNRRNNRNWVKYRRCDDVVTDIWRLRTERTNHAWFPSFLTPTSDDHSLHHWVQQTIDRNTSPPSSASRRRPSACVSRKRRDEPSPCSWQRRENVERIGDWLTWLTCLPASEHEAAFVKR